MPDKPPPEREIWIEPGQDRATRYWQPIVFQGGVRYVLASEVAPPADAVDTSKSADIRTQAQRAGQNIADKYFMSTTSDPFASLEQNRRTAVELAAIIESEFAPIRTQALEKALKMMVELWDANYPDDPCACSGASDDCKYPPTCELCVSRELLVASARALVTPISKPTEGGKNAGQD